MPTCRTLHIPALLCLAWSIPSFGGSLQFTEVTTNAGINHLYTRSTNGLTGPSAVEYYRMTGGAVAEDINGDGWTDLYVLQGDTNANLLYINNGDGTFSNEASARGVAFAWSSVGAAAADYDNDGDMDLAVTKMAEMTEILVNTGSGYFTNYTLPTSKDEGSVRRFSSASWGDLDNNGLLDLLFGQWYRIEESFFVYKNTGLLLAEAYGYLLEDDILDSHVFTPAFIDFNNDRNADLVTSADFNRSQLYVNTGTGYFANVTSGSGIGTDENGMGMAVGDIDNDGYLDLFVTSIFDPTPPTEGKWGITGNRLYRNRGDGTFSDITDAAGVRDGNWGWGAVMGDFDNDGWLDILHVDGWAEAFMTNQPSDFNDQPVRLFRNRGDGTFTNVAAEAGIADTGQGRVVLSFDYDNDGDLDVYIANNQVMTGYGTNAVRTPGPPRLYRNDSDNSNHWINVTLAGTPPFHRNGIGSRVYLRAGSLSQMRELNASSGYLGHGPNRIAHFGLGTNTVIDEVRAEWLTGDAVVRYNVPANQALALGSPQATVSTNYFYGAGTVTASATNVAPPGTYREWVIDGATNSDPVTATFEVGGTHSMNLQVYDGGTNIVWREIRRVRVETAAMTMIGGAGPEWNIQWLARSGYVYQVQSAVDPTGTWLADLPPQTSQLDEVAALAITSAAPGRVIRLLEHPVP